MTLPTGPTPARRAVIAALTTVTGAPRALTSAHLFRAASGAKAAQNPADAKKMPSAFVLFRDATLDGEMENGSSITTHWVVQITCWYYSGSDVLRGKIGSETDTALARLEGDVGLVRAALCAPGALLTDPSGNDTGLCGHALRDDSSVYRVQGPDPLPTNPDNGERIFQVVHFFRASIDTLQP